MRSNAPLETATSSGNPTWLHHGSSISHGSNAARPTGIWPAVAALLGGVELINLGFGGSALLDPFTARTMRDTPADVISIKMGINLVNLDLMRLRALACRPRFPGHHQRWAPGYTATGYFSHLLLYCGIHENTPGPGAFDMAALAEGTMRFTATGDRTETASGKLTLQVIRRELERILGERSLTDSNIHFLDGLALYGEGDAVEHPLPDALHPDAPTHQLMGERFADLAFAQGAPLAATA